MTMAEEHLLNVGLLAAIHHSTEPMVLCDPHQTDMPIIAVNAPFEALTGYSTDEIIGRNCRFLQGPETDPVTVKKMRACFEQQQGCIQWLVNYRKDGSMFWNLLFISPVFAPDGRLLYFFANQHDLSSETPLTLDGFVLGAAHMPAPELTEFHSLLTDIGRGVQAGAHGTEAIHQARALEATLDAARKVAYLATRLQAGP